MADKISVHLDMAQQDPAIPEIGPDECPACKVPAETGFGMAGGGYGVYSFCPQCGQMLSKCQVED